MRPAAGTLPSEAFARRWLRVVGSVTRQTAGTLAGLVFPPSCIACHGATDAPHGLCAACWRGMPFITRPCCERLGTPFAIDLGGPLLSPQAMADPPVFARARAVAAHDGVARSLVHRLKYGDRADLARAMGRMMASAGAELTAEADLIVPVPLHRGRLWSRRYNQAMELARVLGRITEKPVDPSALTRVKATARQTGLTKAQRGENLQGAFRVHDDMRPRVEGRRILLVDDVLTTGATLNAASRALLRARAAHVDVLTFTRVTLQG